MNSIHINSFEDYLIKIDEQCQKGESYNLYRGQSVDEPLLPAVCRDNPEEDTTPKELEMLDELKRRSSFLLNKEHDIWDLLVIAQHYEMKTRLLDWSSNPLVALWFACRSEHRKNQDAFVYVFQADKTALVDKRDRSSPFNSSKTKIFHPTLNNERIIAQSGWFTVHAYSKRHSRFVKLESNTDYKDAVSKIVIPAKAKSQIMAKLSRYGVNNRTVYPDLQGLCRHLNWSYLDKINN